jgi:hypothetical protein
MIGSTTWTTRAAIATIAITLAAGCSSSNSPLGGPYGGTSPAPGPTPAPNKGTPSTDDAGSTDAGDAGGGGPDGASPPHGAMTWTHVYKTYLAGSTPGDCTQCHGELSSPPAAYAWLASRGYIAGASTTLTSTSASCLTWYGGNMPPGGPTSSPQAVADMDAWAAAGAPNN